MRRILLINPNTTQSITDQLSRYTRVILGDAVDVIAVTAGFGAPYIASDLALAVASHAAIEALKSRVEGCDAVYLACFGDPGLAALEEVSPVPVVGMAQASCQAACELGNRFGIVTGGTFWGPAMTRFVAGIGLSHRLASVRTIEPTGDQIARNPQAALTALTEACIACADKDGADVVILGGAALAGLAAQIQPRTSVPVLCSVEAGARAALALAQKAPGRTRA